MTTKTTNTPPSLPGLVLKETLKKNNVSIRRAAKQLGKDRTHFYHIFSGKCRLSPDMALQIESILPSEKAEKWIRLQADYDYELAREKLEQIRAEHSKGTTVVRTGSKPPERPLTKLLTTRAGSQQSKPCKQRLANGNSRGNHDAHDFPHLKKAS